MGIVYSVQQKRGEGCSTGDRRVESEGAFDLHHYSIVRAGQKNSMFTKNKTFLLRS